MWNCGCYAVAGERGGMDYLLSEEIGEDLACWGKGAASRGWSTFLVLSSLTQLLCVASCSDLTAVLLEYPPGSSWSKIH